MGCKDQKMKEKLKKIIDIYEDAECSKVAEIRCLEIVKRQFAIGIGHFLQIRSPNDSKCGYAYFKFRYM